MATKQVNTRLTQETSDRLDELAARTGRTRTFYATLFIERGLDDLEDYFLAKDALEDFRTSGEASVSMADIHWPT